MIRQHRRTPVSRTPEQQSAPAPQQQAPPQQARQAPAQTPRQAEPDAPLSALEVQAAIGSVASLVALVIQFGPQILKLMKDINDAFRSNNPISTR